MKRVFVVMSIAAFVATACSKAEQSERPSESASATGDWQTPKAVPSQPGGAAPMGDRPAGGSEASPHASGGTSGTVLETMNSGGYTYVKVDAAGTEIWAAGPETNVAVGDQVSFSGGAPMQNYHSKTLDRTFPMVYFVSALRVGGASPAPVHGGAAAHGGGQLDPHGGAADAPHAGAPSVAKVDVGKIAKAEGGKTVAEVISGKAALAGRQVVVRGKVVKYNAQVMGRNWLHVQDGSGAAGQNDLTVTTSDPASVGAIVTVRGTVATNKDFGYGYKYDVLVEGAKVTVE